MFGRAGQLSVFGGNWLIRALFAGLRNGERRQFGRARKGGGRQHERGRDATHLTARSTAWLLGVALIEFVGQFGLGQRVVLALLMKVAVPPLPRCATVRFRAILVTALGRGWGGAR